jgi:hypothetical protein
VFRRRQEAKAVALTPVDEAMGHGLVVQGQQPGGVLEILGYDVPELWLSGNLWA